MIIESYRKLGRLWHSYRQETNGVITATTNQILVGKNQRIKGYRGPKIQPEWRSLNPVQLVMEELESEPVHPDKKVRVVAAYVYGRPRYRSYWGDIAVKANVPTKQDLSIASEELKLYETTIPSYLVKCHAKAKSPMFDGLTNLGELKETIQFLKNPLQGILRLGKAMKKGFRRGRGMSLVDYMSGQWLEYRYAIAPLIGTASDVLSIIHSAVGDGTILYKVHSGALPMTIGGVKESIVRGAYNFGPTTDELIGVKTEKLTIRPGVVCWVRSHQGDNSRWGMTASDIPSTIWELIPYSFMVDWVFGVGDYIRAITPNGDKRVVSSAASLCIEKTSEIKGTMIRAQGYDGWKYYPCETSSKYTRRVLLRRTDLPLPLFPQLNMTILNWKRSLDSVSIFGIAPLKKLFCRK